MLFRAIHQSACLLAFRETGEERWRKGAWSAFNWFLGDNVLQIVLYDSATGGCLDGLHPDRGNEKQGAESVLSFRMALLEMRQLEESEIPLSKHELAAEDKDAALLPRRINGLWALVHRPMTPLGAHMWISYSPDLRYWSEHRMILQARLPSCPTRLGATR